MTEKEDIQKKYEAVSKKYKIPTFEKVNWEFEIRFVEDDDFLLRNVRRKMIDKIAHFSKILEGFMQPDTTLSELTECKVFSEEEKKELWETYVALMRIQRQGNLLDLEIDDEKEAQFINETNDQWNKIKNKIRGFITRSRDSWSTLSDSMPNLNYFG